MLCKRKRLLVDELVLIGNRPFRVLRVGPGTATVEPLEAVHARFTTGEGRDVEFDAPARRMNISPWSDVKRVDPAEVEAMSKKTKTPKTPKAPKTPRTPKADGTLMTFAFRLAPEESAAIHKAAGHRNASQFARAVLVAAANADLKAVQAAIDAGAAAGQSA